MSIFSFCNSETMFWTREPFGGELDGDRIKFLRNFVTTHTMPYNNRATSNTAQGVATTEEEEAAPGGIRRIVFDEGHHLFDAADSAFSGHLTALETAELRRWIRGPEAERRRGRGRLGHRVSVKTQHPARERWVLCM